MPELHNELPFMVSVLLDRMPNKSKFTNDNYLYFYYVYLYTKASLNFYQDHSSLSPIKEYDLLLECIPEILERPHFDLITRVLSVFIALGNLLEERFPDESRRQRTKEILAPLNLRSNVSHTFRGPMTTMMKESLGQDVLSHYLSINLCGALTLKTLNDGIASDDQIKIIRQDLMVWVSSLGYGYGNYGRPKTFESNDLESLIATMDVLVHQYRDAKEWMRHFFMAHKQLFQDPAVEEGLKKFHLQVLIFLIPSMDAQLKAGELPGSTHLNLDKI